MSIYSDGRLHLFGAVGSDFPGEPGFSSADVRQALNQHGDGALSVHINSGGGYASEGAAIHAILSRHPGGVDIIVEGIAASAASLIAMAGRTVTMALGSVMMIHDPAATTSGDSAAHKQSIAGLEALATSYAGIYAAKSGKTAAACRAIMRAETWFTPEEAVAAGFANKVGSMRAVAMAPFPYSKYANVPAQVQSFRLKDMARRPSPYSHPPSTFKPKDTSAMAAAVAETNARTAGKKPAPAPRKSSLAAVMDSILGKR